MTKVHTNLMYVEEMVKARRPRDLMVHVLSHLSDLEAHLLLEAGARPQATQVAQALIRDALNRARLTAEAQQP